MGLPLSMSLTILNLAGSVALLLWGVRMVQTGIHRAFGAPLRSFLAQALKDRFKSFLAGLGVTAILQSSTATGLMVTSFAAVGLVNLVPALAVMLGANVGTTLIVQALSFDIATIAPALILFGAILFQRATAGMRDFGRVLIGLGLTLMSLHQFIGLLKPYEEVEGLRLVLGAISTQPFLDVVLAAVITWIMHSSVAVVLLIMSFTDQGMISLPTAFYFVLGANLGSALNPVIESASGCDPAAKRLPVGNLVNRLIGVALGLAVVPYVTPLMTQIEPDNARAVANFHTAFNIALAILFFPFLTPFAAVLRRVLPTRISPNDPAKPLYLNPNGCESPAVALGSAAREALRMTDVLTSMLEGFRDALVKPDRRLIDEVKRSDDILDKLNSAIKAYLVSLDPNSLDASDHRRLSEILIFATNIEQAGDTVDRNLLNLASKRMKRGLSFSEEGKRELLALAERLIANTRQAASAFLTEDMRAARILAKEKQVFRDSETEATAGLPKRPASSFVRRADIR